MGHGGAISYHNHGPGMCRYLLVFRLVLSELKPAAPSSVVVVISNNKFKLNRYSHRTINAMALVLEKYCVPELRLGTFLASLTRLYYWVSTFYLFHNRPIIMAVNGYARSPPRPLGRPIGTSAAKYEKPRSQCFCLTQLTSTGSLSTRLLQMTTLVCLV